MSSGYYFKCSICDELTPEMQQYSKLVFYKKGHPMTRVLLKGCYDQNFCEKCSDLLEGQIALLKQRVTRIAAKTC